MARPPKIRITENDRKEYAKLVKNTKAKVNRTLKNFQVDLSDEVEIPKLESFKTRKEFTEWKEKASSFTNKNNLRFQFVKNESGLVISKSELNEMKRLNAREIRIAKERKKAIEKESFISGGKVVGTVGERVRMMKNPNAKGVHVPSKFDFNKVHSYTELRKRKESMENRSNPTFYNKRSQRFKELFIHGLQEMFNSDADHIVEMLDKVSPEDFYWMYQKFDDFEPLFDPSPQKGMVNGVEVDESGQQSQLDRIENYIELFLEGKLGELDDDMKGF